MDGWETEKLLLRPSSGGDAGAHCLFPGVSVGYQLLWIPVQVAVTSEDFGYRSSLTGDGVKYQ